MTPDSKTNEQAQFIVPDLTIKDLLSAIPAHCFKRSGLRSSTYVIWDFFLLACIYKTAEYADSLVQPAVIELPYPILYGLGRFAVWALYTLAAGLVMTGLWVIAHECGHQAFSESKFLNNLVGWVLHSGLGVPYHSWRISHGKHHAATGHMTQDQVFVPKTRSQLGLPPLDPAKEDILGANVSEEVKKELYEALGDAPIAAAFNAAVYLLIGWPAYLIRNASGQKHYPVGTNHYKPTSHIFGPHQWGQIVLSDIGVAFWLAAIGYSIHTWGFFEVFRLYLIPYLWVNHWLVLITFLQHTDPLLPHYRPAEFTFPRGALTTMDRNLLGELGPVMSWIGALTTHGIAETHVAHHVHSKIPHYHAWDATYALRDLLAQRGIHLEGRAAGWGEMYRVMKACRFVEDEGDVVFYKNAYGVAAARPVFPDGSASDSGIELVDKDS